MPTRAEQTEREVKLKRRAEALQARYGGVIKQARLALDDVGNRDLSTALEEGRFSFSEVKPGVVLTKLPAGTVLVCCGGVSRGRRGSPFALLIKREKDVVTPMGRQDSTSALLPETLRKVPSAAIPSQDVQQDGDSGLPDQVRSKRK